MLKPTASSWTLPGGGGGRAAASDQTNRLPVLAMDTLKEAVASLASVDTPSGKGHWEAWYGGTTTPTAYKNTNRGRDCLPIAFPQASPLHRRRLRAGFGVAGEIVRCRACRCMSVLASDEDAGVGWHVVANFGQGIHRRRSFCLPWTEAPTCRGDQRAKGDAEEILAM